MPIQESGEMYLESILVLSKEKNVVRAVDISAYMGLSKPAVSRALSKLREEKLILIDKEGYIAFTENGRRIADNINKKHVLLTELIMRLGVDEETAAEDACKIEHVISDKTFEAMINHSKKHT
ncbi:MAG: metal-dependent transcriptional regulator [Clostridiales bacterium]|nr:metal-dependent transcriptional regulator [Clostridiales bacterium]